MKKTKPRIIKFKDRELAVNHAFRTNKKVEPIKTPKSEYKYKVQGSISTLYT